MLGKFCDKCFSESNNHTQREARVKYGLTSHSVNPLCLTTLSTLYTLSVNLLKPTGHVMHQQFNIQQLYALPTLYLFVLYLSENKQRLVPLTV